MPYQGKELDVFKTIKILKGFTKEQFENKGFKIKLNLKALSLVEEVQEASEEYRRIKDKTKKQSISPTTKFPAHLIPQLKSFLSKVSETLTEFFLEISPLNFLNRIEINYDNTNVLALSLVLVLKKGTRCRPNQLLSEANLDLLALLFFLSFMKESVERGQAKVIILDDVLQSVDATIRVSFITYLLKNFPDWQYIITAHDRLWYRQLTDMMKQSSHLYFDLAITGWTFENGPEIGTIPTDKIESLKSALNENSIFSICANSGLLLEELSDALSKSLGTSVRRNKEDKYTLGDITPNLFKELKKTNLKGLVEEVEKSQPLRNSIGSHHNDWALSLSLSEAKQFANSVTTLFDSVKCKKCFGYISGSSALDFYACKCGNIMISKK